MFSLFSPFLCERSYQCRAQSGSGLNIMSVCAMRKEFQSKKHSFLTYQFSIADYSNPSTYHVRWHTFSPACFACTLVDVCTTLWRYNKYTWFLSWEDLNLPGWDKYYNPTLNAHSSIIIELKRMQWSPFYISLILTSEDEENIQSIAEHPLICLVRPALWLLYSLFIYTSDDLFLFLFVVFLSRTEWIATDTTYHNCWKNVQRTDHDFE